MDDYVRDDEYYWNVYNDLADIYTTIDKLIDRLKEKDVIDGYKNDLLQIKLDAKDQMDDLEDELFIEEDDENIAELINEENYYNDIWLKENGYDI